MGNVSVVLWGALQSLREQLIFCEKFVWKELRQGGLEELVRSQLTLLIGTPPVKVRHTSSTPTSKSKMAAWLVNSCGSCRISCFIASLSYLCLIKEIINYMKSFYLSQFVLSANARLVLTMANLPRTNILFCCTGKVLGMESFPMSTLT